MHTRWFCSLLISALLSGCLYIKGNLDLDSKGGYKSYPDSVEAERERRAKRRRTALIAAPLEIGGGTALAALALFAESKPTADGDDSVTDNLGDGAKDLAGRLLIASLGGAIALSGVGDLLLGLTDRFHTSPLIRNDRLVPESMVDLLPPPRTPRLTLHAANMLGTHAAGGGFGFGVAHWLDRRFRLRHGLTGGFRVPYARDLMEPFKVQWGGELETHAQLAFARERAGLYPRHAIGLYAGVAGSWTDHLEPAAIGGLSTTIGFKELRLGSRYSRTEGYSFDLSMRLEIGGD